MEFGYMNFRSIGLALGITALLRLGVSALEFEMLDEESKDKVMKIDSSYHAKQDSLRRWYAVTMDSLRRDYETKRNIETLTH